MHLYSPGEAQSLLFIFLSAFLDIKTNASHSSDAFQLAVAYVGMCSCLHLLHTLTTSTLLYANYVQMFATSQGGVARFTWRFPHPVLSRNARRVSQSASRNLELDQSEVHSPGTSVFCLAGPRTVPLNISCGNRDTEQQLNKIEGTYSSCF